MNGFYQQGFVPDREPRWRESPLSILHMANQSRVMQHAWIARRNFADLQRAIPDVIELTPVEYSKVQGAGLYAEFLDNRRWAGPESSTRADRLWSGPSRLPTVGGGRG